MLRQAAALQPIEVHGGADIHPTDGGGLQAGTGGCSLKEAVTPWKACAEAGSWQELWPMKRSQLWRGFLAEAVGPWGTHAGAVCL